MPPSSDRKVTPDDIVARRRQALEVHHLTLEKMFDTFEKEHGAKDVSLCRTKDNKRVILRVGEIRPVDFFPDGYRGTNLLIPRLFYTTPGDIPYEIEEYIVGPYAAGAGGISASPSGQLNRELVQRLVRVFWEFQEVGAVCRLEPSFGTDKVLKHFELAKKYLSDPAGVQQFVITHKDFWEGHFPSKWKFATDNLIFTNGDRVAFIDLAHVGLRYWGYDLGWVMWPRWVEMETKYYAKFDNYLVYLEQFLETVRAAAPENFSYPRSLEQWFWLVVFERTIGALYDVANNTKHLKEWNLHAEGSTERRAAHVQFVRSLLDKAMKQAVS